MMVAIMSVGAGLSIAIMTYQQYAVKNVADSVRYADLTIVRSAFEGAAKKLRHIYHDMAFCDPQLFAQAISTLPNPTGFSTDPDAGTLCTVKNDSSCRALEVLSSDELKVSGVRKASMYVMVGLVSFSRQDPCNAASPVSDLNNNCSEGIPQSSAGVHLYTKLNHARYDQWVVLLDTCSSNQVTTLPGGRSYGMGFGTSWQLGSAYSPFGGVDDSPGNGTRSINSAWRSCGGTNAFGTVRLLDFRRLASFIQAPFDMASDFPNPECMDLTQDGVVDERDLNVFEKFLMGWIPTIPIRR